jgi:hypothetical protein
MIYLVALAAALACFAAAVWLTHEGAGQRHLRQQ